MKTDCEAGIAHLGKDAASLTGWTCRVAASVAHLAGAWAIGDPENAPRAVLAIVALCGGMRPKVFDLMMRVALHRAGGPIKDGGRGSELVERCRAVAAHIDAATAAGEEAAGIESAMAAGDEADRGPTEKQWLHDRGLIVEDYQRSPLTSTADSCTCLNPAESYIHGHEPSCPRR